MDSLSIEQPMKAIPAEIEVYPVHHLPIIKAYADKLGLVDLINHWVPTGKWGTLHGYSG